MKRARAAAGWECFLYFCVLEEAEFLAPDATAVKQHASCRFVGIAQGTTLLDGLKKMRALVGSNARVDGLDDDLGWLALEPEILSYVCAAGDTFYFRFVRSAEVMDNSRAWAVAVLKPFPFSVLELEGLRRALSAPLPLPLPISSATYKQHQDSMGPDFVPTSSYPAETIAALTSFFIRSRTETGMSENLYQSIWDTAFCNLWLELLPLADISIVEFNRNVTDYSGASIASTRPDLMLWILNRLCAKFEEKRFTIHEAVVDLERKLANLEAQYYGPVQWIIGVALAGERMAAWALRRGQTPENLIGPLKMTSLKDKMACLQFSVNLLRVALSLAETYANLIYLPRPFRTLQPSVYGEQEQIRRTIRIVNAKVIKEISPWSEHVHEGFTQLHLVEKAYGLQAPGLISGQVLLRGDKYKVTMNTVGFQHTVSTEAELLESVKDVLMGLKALHAAGLVHRDIRWKNILKIPTDGYMLIDFETVWECGDEPDCCELRAWDEQTLVEGKYTEGSDLYLVGKLMSSVPDLSQGARAFQLMLLGHQFATAKNALEHLTAI